MVGRPLARFISSVELGRVMLELGEQLSQEEVTVILPAASSIAFTIAISSLGLSLKTNHKFCFHETSSFRRKRNRG